MSEICARLDVRCPDREATRHLAEYFERNVVAVGIAAIRLRLPAAPLAGTKSSLERQVFATLATLRPANDPLQTYSVDLAYGVGEPARFFAGALAVCASIADDRVGLVLAGHYEPPIRTADSSIERDSGYREACSAASELLRTIAAHVELASARNEAAHAGKGLRASRSKRRPAMSVPPATAMGADEMRPTQRSL